MSVLFAVLAAVVLGVLAYLVMRAVCEKSAVDVVMDVVVVVAAMWAMMHFGAGVRDAALYSGVGGVVAVLARQLHAGGDKMALVWRPVCVVASVVVVCVLVKHGVHVG